MTRRRLTVLQIVPRLEVGGAERATVDIAAALVAAGHRALVASAGGSMVEALVKCGAEHFTHGVATKNPWTVAMNGQWPGKFALDQGVDIVHARSRAPAWSSYWATRRSNIPFVTTFHDACPAEGRAKKLYNSVMARGDRVIAISRFIDEHVRTSYPPARERLVVIPRGIDFSVFDPARITTERKERFRAEERLAANVPLVILPARMSPTKGHELAWR